MRNRKGSISYTGLRKANPNPLSFIWLIWGVVVVSGLCVATFQSVAHFDVPSRLTFPGSLSPRTNLAEIRLPHSAVIKQIVVKEHETVTAGQTLITLDLDEMKKKKGEHERNLRVSRFLITCLQRPMSYPPEKSQNAHEEELALLRDAHSFCRDFFDSERQELARLIASKETLKIERKLIQQYMDLQVLGMNNPNPKEIEQLVSLSLLDTQLEKSILGLESEQNEINRRTAREQSDIFRRELSKIQSHLNEIDRLDELIANPRVVSTDQGQVLRVRRPVNDEIENTSETLIQIETPAAPKYSVSAYVPTEVAKHLHEDQSVEFKVLSLGAINSHRTLSGNFGAIGAALGERVEIEVKVSTHTSSVLAELTTGIAFGGKNSAAEISVWTNPKSFRGYLDQNLSNAIPEVLHTSFDGLKEVFAFAILHLRKLSTSI